MRYHYLGYNKIKGITTGEVAASSEAEAVLAVKEQGYKLLELRPHRQFSSLDKLFPSLFRLSTGEVARFAQQLATLIGTGTGLVRALQLMQRQVKNRVLQRTLTAIMESLDRGESLSSAMSQHPKVFSRVFCRVIEVGEYSGRLDSSLRHIGDLLQRESQSRQKAMKALMYPMGVVGLGLITTAVLFTVALPPLLTMFTQMGSELPVATQIAITLAEVVQKAGAYLLIGPIVLVVLINRLLRVRRVHYWWDTLRLRIPILGSFLEASELARASRSASILLEAGVTIPLVMDLMVEASGNLVMRRAFSDARESLMQGETLADGLGRHRAMPPMFVQMVATGEETNSLPQTMKDAADTYQQQADDKLNALISTLEPMATVGVAMLIGFIAFSMFMPIYSGLGAIK